MFQRQNLRNLQTTEGAGFKNNAAFVAQRPSFPSEISKELIFYDIHKFFLQIFPGYDSCPCCMPAPLERFTLTAKTEIYQISTSSNKD